MPPMVHVPNSKPKCYPYSLSVVLQFIIDNYNTNLICFNGWLGISNYSLDSRVWYRKKAQIICIVMQSANCIWHFCLTLTTITLFNDVTLQILKCGHFLEIKLIKWFNRRPKQQRENVFIMYYYDIIFHTHIKSPHIVISTSTRSW